MIELHIAPGCAWSVWQTQGGLQPDLESLGIPHELIAKFKPWKGRWCSALWKPHFTGRKEYDTEGRAIAAELQQAIGDRIHVVFRHWLAFDPVRWRTQWQEENLATGQREEFWIEDDLPADLALKVVRVFPDFAGAYLWDLDGCCIGNADPAFSDDLDERFTAWSKSYEACFDNESRQMDRTRLAAERFDERGLALAMELQRSIGDAARVIFCCTLSKTLVEVLEAGKSHEWARGTDFRQWALDQRSRGQAESTKS